MKHRSTYTPLAVLLIGTACLILVVKLIQPSNKKVNQHIITDISNQNVDDILLPSTPINFDTIGSPFLDVRGNKEQTVKLQDLKIYTNIQEKVATTRYEMTFYNAENRNLEAELNFPLAKGQTITSFSMDINGKMRQGVAVEKEKARVAFETTIRQNIDPGLVEMTKGNNFKARVFPVPANGFKKIIIEVTEELISDQKNTYYRLPLGFNDKLNNFNLSVDVLEQEVSPNTFPTSSNELKFSKIQKKYTAKISKKDFLATDPLIISVPANSESKKALTATKGESIFFHASLEIPNRFKIKTKPEYITVFWDVSASRKSSNLEKELNLLTDYLKNLKNVTLEILPFANKVISSSIFKIENGRTDEISKHIKSFKYDGGTILNDLPIENSNGEEVLIFTDGIANLGSTVSKVSGVRIYTIFSSSVSDPSALEALSLKSNGECIDLNTTSTNDGLNRLKMDQLHFMGFENNDNLLEFYPRKGMPSYGYIGVSGKIKSKTGELTALFGYGNQIVKKEKINLKNGEYKKNAAVLEKLLVIKKISQLNLNYKANKKQITELGITHRLVTKNTSLLVLDRLDDYLEHEIVPPLELQKEYYKRLAVREKREANKKIKHLQEVYTSFKEQKAWWNKKYKKKEKKAVPSEEVVPVMSYDRSEESAPRDASENLVLSAPPMEANLTTVGSSSNTYSFNQITPLGYDANEKSVGPRGAIHIQGWDPKSPYMKKIKAVDLNKAYAVYLEEKTKYGSQPSYYLDVADYFIDKGRKKEGLRVLSNIAELELENHSLLRILAHKLLQLGENKTALQLFKDLIELRPEEPQSYRDLGLAYVETGNNDLAIQYLYKVVTGDYDERFNGIQVIALNEINNIISQSSSELKTDYIDKRFIDPMPVDIRVVLNWDADNTDVDLWVIDPKGEKCFYSNKYTSIGGRISNDFTQGYGPEEFMIRKAIPGKYKIKAHYYGSSSQSIQGKATLSVQFFKQFGTRNEEKQEITRRLNVTKDVIDLGTFTF